MVDLLILNGPEIGRTAQVKEGVKFLGRSKDNDIRIADETVSRKHLKIEVKNGTCQVTDLKSQNGTFYRGKYLVPGRQVEIAEGTPLAIGMTVICLGKGCREQMAPFLDTVTLVRGKDKKDTISTDRRKRTKQKRGDLLSRVSLTLKDTIPLRDMLEQVLDHIFHHLQRIDRGAFLLVDPDTSEIYETVSKWSKPKEATGETYSEEVVRRVLQSSRPLVYSKIYTEDGPAVIDTLKVLRIESVLCAPLLSGSGLIGAMYLDSLKRPDGFRKDDLLLLLDIGQRIAVAVERDRFASDILELSNSLTDDAPS
jgi:pSer/pThr/pTyr-binding forkhead associated (FHA) protein